MAWLQRSSLSRIFRQPSSDKRRERKSRQPRRLSVQPLEERNLLAATVITDLPDYHPGDTAQIVAQGFQSGETLQFQVAHDASTPGIPGGAGHDPWKVTDGATTAPFVDAQGIWHLPDLDGKVDGNVQTSWYVNPDDSAGATFNLSAYGMTSELSAITTFTDSAPAVKLGGYGNKPTAGYVGGNLSSGKAAYTEGQSIPYRYAAADAQEGAQITILFHYQFQKVTGSDTDNTFDFLTSDDVTIAVTDTIRFGGDGSTLPSGFNSPAWNPGFTDSIAIPDDPSNSHDTGTRNFLVYSNFANTSIVSTTYLGIDPGNSDQKIIQLVLQMGDNGDATPNEANVDFAVFFGGHLARDVDYVAPDSSFEPNGAADAPGSSFFISVTATQNVSGNIGNESTNVQSGAVVNTSLEWEKRDSSGALLGGATFTVTPNPFGADPLTVVDNGAFDDDPDAGQIKVSNLPFGTYTITETVPPSGYVLDADNTRVQSVTSADPNAVVGTQGTDNLGTSDESDFHNSLSTGSITWEKRDGSNANVLLAGATFEVRNASNNALVTTVTDNGANDADNTAGVIKVTNIPVGSYTVTETVAPTGYALDSTPRSVSVTIGTRNPVIGTSGQDDVSDFHDFLGSLRWEKRDGSNSNVLLGGATFTVKDSTNAVIATVTDNGAGDADPTAGVIQLNKVKLGAYTITETVAPTGYALDASPTRPITVSAGNTITDLGTAGSNDTNDFHDFLGSLRWEKRDGSNSNVLLGGATFTVKDSTNAVIATVTDNGTGDADPTAGVIQLNKVKLGTYTITETVAPTGYALDAGPTRTITVSAGNTITDLGTAGSNDTSDFHDFLGSLRWEKRDITNGNVLLGGATFTVKDAANNVVATVTDNGAGDENSTAGVIQLNKVKLGTYTITETVAPIGYLKDTTPTRTITVLAGAPTVTDLGIFGSNDTSDFHDKRINVVVIGPDKGNTSQPIVKVVDGDTGKILTQFQAYETNFLGGVHVATGDIDGDGFQEIITAPGRGRTSDVKIWGFDPVSGTYILKSSFMAYAPSFTGGVNLAIGDINGDHKNDIVTAPTYGVTQVRAFFNNGGTFSSTPSKTIDNVFPSTFLGGADVAVADVGTFSNGKLINATTPDGKSEIIVGNGPGMRSTIYVYDVSGTPTKVNTVLPFNTTFIGGITVQAARINSDLVPDFIVSAGNGGGSTVEIWSGVTGAAVRLTSFTTFTDTATSNAPVHAVAVDTNGDGVADTIIAAQGTNGASNQIRYFPALPSSSKPTPKIVPNSFLGPWFIAPLTGLNPAAVDKFFGKP